ncbi:MAG: hypothetical protein PF518_12600 [Spirochaetaceae bacterium]|jgi:hypothetical protein|nr:hypothetical protein [Spirochaetaceae bacterium]
MNYGTPLFKRLSESKRDKILDTAAHKRKILLSLSLFLILGSQLDAQNPDSVIIPGPVPFSLDATSAIYCINLLKNNRFIEFKNDTGKTEIVKVHTVWSIFLGLDENYPKGHHRRYDIIVNGTPLDWDKSFIEYGGEMINLHLLFLYRNQYPPQGLEYKNNP